MRRNYLLIGILLLGAVYFAFSVGSFSYTAEYRSLVSHALAKPPVAGTVTDADLAHLPEPVAAYVRLSGAVGQPRVFNFRARFHGAIRSSPTSPWMQLTGEQVSVVEASPTRLFRMDAVMFDLPVDVLHVLIGRDASMRAKVLSLVPVVNERGAEMSQSESVTYLNDIAVLAPAALVEPFITWDAIDARSARATYLNGPYAARAVLSFNDAGELVNFVSDDRLRGPLQGQGFVHQRWSTPIRDYRVFGARRIATRGEVHWHAPAPEGEFAYLQYWLNVIEYNVPASSR